MGKLGVAIIGCGSVAEEYVKAFTRDERSEVRALVSRNRLNAERYRDKYDLACTIETNASVMLQRKDVDIVVICTPHNQHTNYVVVAAEAGRHIIIEKPVALTLQDLRKQQQAVKKSKVKTLVSFVLPCRCASRRKTRQQDWNPLLTCRCASRRKTRQQVRNGMQVETKVERQY